MIARLIFLVFLSIGSVCGTCFKENTRWLSSNTLDIQRPIDNPYQCQGICADLDGCLAFTWTSEDTPELHLFCLLFSATSNQTFCEGCVSGPARCTCSKEEACVPDGNFLDNIPGVLEEGQCQNVCAGTSSCLFYTWHDATTFYPYTCLLLTSCDHTETCSGCFSGPSVCSSDNPTTTPAPETEGIIISGGMSHQSKSVEVFVPSTGQSCSLPLLPDVRHSHTMDSLLICGGTKPTCLSFNSGQWITSHQIGMRQYHNSWQTEQGVVLMGGGQTLTTSEIVTMAGGQGEPFFTMQYRTSYACSMPDPTSDSVFITGGLKTPSTVSRYEVMGWVEDLPSLVEGRHAHGCGSFLRSDNTQVLLVAGGQGLSSTEVLTMDSPVWTLTTPLPTALIYLRGVTVSGKFYLTGGRETDGSDRDEIICWLDKEQEWEETGKMKMGRTLHAVSTIKMDDPAMEHCG